jgi:snapalysin
MLHRLFIGILTTTVLVAPSASAAPAPGAVAPSVVTLTYDDSQAAEFKSAVAQAVEVWNTTVKNVKLTPASGDRADIRISADDGWPHAVIGPIQPGGSGEVVMGRSATQEGHDPIRIAAHELGHNFGLPDTKPGPCTSLMSGSSAGTTCKNPKPDANETSEVERNYGSGATANPTPTVVQDVG